MKLSYTLASYLDGVRTGAMAANISAQLIALTRADIGTCQGESGGGMSPRVIRYATRGR